MKSVFSPLFFFLLHIVSLEALMVHQQSPIEQEWKEENLAPFDELMVSWNAIRPVEGKFLFYVSVMTDDWSPWLVYASWGSDGQSSFLSTTHEAPVRVYQDALEVLQRKKATAFQMKIVPEGSASLKDIHALHVYTNADKDQGSDKPGFYPIPTYLNVPGISQMALNHVRCGDLCSPTSTTAVTRFLSNHHAIDPISFAQNVWDAGFDIYGNWVFNVAQASTFLGPEWNCWVERLKGFDEIYNSLTQGIPVVVSVRGPLPGSAQPYAGGHLMVVTGYDPCYDMVFCMDPAFPTDNATYAAYDLSSFLEAWSRRGNVAYFFTKNNRVFHQGQ